ncbi:unnamed protein product, partial [Heterotrigona itama]
LSTTLFHLFPHLSLCLLLFTITNLTCMFSLGSEFVIKSFIAVLFLKLRIFPFHN